MRSCQHSEPEFSAALLAAQRQLQAIRRNLNIEPNTNSASLIPDVYSGVEERSWLLLNGQQELQRRREKAGKNQKKSPSSEFFDIASQRNAAEPPPEIQVARMSENIAVYPSLLMAMLKQNQEAVGRVYLLLRHLDRNGRGWLPVEEIREKLTRIRSPLKVMGRRRLRQVLQQGEGTFWTRDSKGRLWLRSAAKIALKLDCFRFRGNRVDLPIKTLLGGIGAVRAHFYACFHSGRGSDNPISRETLETMTGLSPRTQREYDRTAGVQRQQNIAVGPEHTQIAAEEQAWRRGRAVFTFVDSQGKQGPKNRQYIAWRLPNSYQAPHPQRSKGRQKKINQQLASLVNHGVQGNGQGKVDKLFWTDGAAAGKAYSRDQELDAYWPRGVAQRRPVEIWYVLAGKVE